MPEQEVRPEDLQTPPNPSLMTKEEEAEASGVMPDDVGIPPEDLLKKKEVAKKDEKTPIDDPEHPRFKDIYAKMKNFERGLSEKDEAIISLKQHNETLQSAIDAISSKSLDEARPDPVSDPEAFAKWSVDVAKREISKGAKGNGADKVDKSKDIPKPIEGDIRLSAQIAAMDAVYEDYNEMIEGVKDDIEKDDVLRNRIWSSPNPPREAYKYAVTKKGQKFGERLSLLNKGTVEGGGGPSPLDDKVGGLSQAQLAMAKKMGVDPKKYKIQLDYINKQRGE